MLKNRYITEAAMVLGWGNLESKMSVVSEYLQTLTMSSMMQFGRLRIFEKLRTYSWGWVW
jgi:hypothetical protein